METVYLYYTAEMLLWSPNLKSMMWRMRNVWQHSFLSSGQALFIAEITDGTNSPIKPEMK